MLYGEPATAAPAPDPTLLKLALLTLSPFNNPLAPNSVPAKLNVCPYTFAWLLAVSVKPTGLTVSNPFVRLTA